jgi:PGF-pre-PGF domain-containing protein
LKEKWRDRNLRRLLSLILSIVLLSVIFLYPSPAYAVTVTLEGVDPEYTQGDTDTIRVIIEILSTELIPISDITLKIDGPTDVEVSWDAAGSIIKSHPAIPTISPPILPSPSYGYFYAQPIGYFYGYGYGYGGPQFLTYSLTLDTNFLAVGQYTIKAILNATGNLFESTTIIFRVVKVFVPPPPPPPPPPPAEELVERPAEEIATELLEAAPEDAATTLSDLFETDPETAVDALGAMVEEDPEAAGDILATLGLVDPESAADLLGGLAEEDPEAAGSALVNTAEEDPEAAGLMLTEMTIDDPTLAAQTLLEASDVDPLAAGAALANAAEADPLRGADLIEAAVETDVDRAAEALEGAILTEVEPVVDALLNTPLEVRTEVLGEVDPETFNVIPEEDRFDLLENLPGDVVGDVEIPVPENRFVRRERIAEREVSEGPARAGEFTDFFDSPRPLTDLLIKFTRDIDVVTVDAGPLPAKPPELPDVPGGLKTFMFFNITVVGAGPEDIDVGYVSFAVNNSWIEANDINRLSITLWRYNGDLNLWLQLPTRQIDRNATHTIYTSVTSEFSVFAITGSETALPAGFTTANLTISPSRAKPGELVTIQVDYTNVAAEAITIPATLWINDVVEEVLYITLEPNETRTVTFTTVKTAVDLYKVRVDRQIGHFTTSAFPMVSQVPELLTEQGLPLVRAEVDTPFLVRASFTSFELEPKTFLLIVQVLDARGVAIHTALTAGTIDTLESVTLTALVPGLKAGTYTVEVYVWSSLLERIPQADVVRTTVEVGSQTAS